MRAVVFEEWKTFPALRDREIPTSRSGEALLKVAGAGDCHSDAAIFQSYDTDSNQSGLTPGFVLGHESNHIIGGNVSGSAVVTPNTPS